MDSQFWSNFNWVDIVLLIVIFRALFIGISKGFVTELFKIFGVYFATILTLHYYCRLGAIFNKAVMLPISPAECLAFVLLSVLIVVLFKFVREGWLLILKMEAKAGFNQWGGGIVGVLRGVLISSLILFFVAVTGQKTLISYAQNSIAGHYLIDVSPKVYEGTFNSVIVKFFPQEPSNTIVIPKNENKAEKKKVNKKK